MKVLDLFSGIGGFSLGLEAAGMTTKAFCEQDKFCQKVLRKHWPNIPIYNDVRTIDYDKTIDLICGGFPCQGFSVAGKQKGKEDDRYLWPEMLTCIKKYRPRWVIGENVAGIINLALDDVLSDLEGEGYSTRAFVIPACSINAPHRRDRVWIVANTNDKRCKGLGKEEIQGEQGRAQQPQGSNKEWRRGWDLSSPRVCGVDDGIPDRTHRLKALGNAVVPQLVGQIGRHIMDIERCY